MAEIIDMTEWNKKKQSTQEQQQRKKQIEEILLQGVQDEMNAAHNYMRLSGKFSDEELQSAFINYAAEELNHAHKLLKLLPNGDEVIGQVPIADDEMDDIYLYLIEYMAREESAIFYYEALENLTDDEEIQRMCKEIRGEEQLHLRQIKELYQRVKEHGFHE